MTSHPSDLRDRIADTVQSLLMDTLPKVIARARAYEVADAVLAVLPEPADQTGEFELRGDTEVRAATLREVEQHVRQLARATFQPYYRSAYATLADDISRLADETPATPTTADKAAHLGMTPNDYRAASHRAAVDQIRAALPGLYATVGLRVEAALEADETQPAQPKRVKHSGPNTKFCVGCLSGEHERMADETPPAETQIDEDPARIDRLRPEFTDHASVEAIDVQLKRARAQERRWHLRAEWLISLRATRVAQKERGEQPAAGARQDGAQPS